ASVTGEEGAGVGVVGVLKEQSPAGVAVAQQQAAFVGAEKPADPRPPPVQPDGAEESGAGDLVVVDVVDFQPAAAGVAHDHVSLGAVAAESCNPPVQPDGAEESGAGDLVVADVVNPHSSGAGLAQVPVVVAAAREIAEALALPVQADVAEERGVGNVVVADVVDFKAAG